MQEYTPVKLGEALEGTRHGMDKGARGILQNLIEAVGHVISPQESSGMDMV